MSERQLWERYKKYLCEVESVGLTLDVSRMNFADDFLERMRGPHGARPSTRWRRWRRAPSPTRTRSAWWATTGCAPPSCAPEPGLTQGQCGTRWSAVRGFANDVHAGRVKPPKADAVHPAAGDRHRRLGAGAAARGGRARHGARTGCGCSSSTTRTRTGWTGCWRSSGERALRDAHRGHQQVGRHEGDAQRHAGGASARTRRRGSTSAQHAVAVTGEGSELDSYAKQGKWLRTLPDVGLGWRAHLGAVGGGPAAGARCRGWTSTGCSAGARDMDEATRERERAARTRPR